MLDAQKKNILLKRVSIFKDLDEFALQNLASKLEPVNYPRDTEIFRQDDDGDALFIVVKGRVKVVLHNENGREAILTIFKAEDFFGEMSLLDGEPRSAGVYTTEKSTLLRLSRQHFVEHLEAFPPSARQILSEMCTRLRRASEIIGNLSSLDVYGRIARVLIDLAKSEGERQDEGIFIKNRPTQQELASMVGTTRETVSRVLSEFQKRGLIATQGKTVLLSYGFAEEGLGGARAP